jgi:hypothetical protein
MDQWRALENTVMNLWVPLIAGKFCSYTTGGFSRSARLHIVSFLVIHNMLSSVVVALAAGAAAEMIQ